MNKLNAKKKKYTISLLLPDKKASKTKYKCYCGFPSIAGFYLNHEAVCSNTSQTEHKAKLRTIPLDFDFKKCGQDTVAQKCTEERTMRSKQA